MSLGSGAVVPGTKKSGRQCPDVTAVLPFGNGVHNGAICLVEWGFLIKPVNLWVKILLIQQWGFGITSVSAQHTINKSCNLKGTVVQLFSKKITFNFFRLF